MSKEEAIAKLEEGKKLRDSGLMTEMDFFFLRVKLEHIIRKDSKFLF
jgi:hypothetical protein